MVKLVSNASPNKISGLEDFLGVFNSSEAKAEISQFRYVVQRRVKRALGGKFAKGITVEATENTEVNLNEDLVGLRRWLGAIRQDSGSVMLLNIFKIKEDSLAAPLIFSEMLKTGRPILVTGADPDSRAQLTTTIDLTCSKIPPEIEQNETLKNSLLVRVERRKGFMQTVRNLLDFDFLPDEVRNKIREINTGGDPTKLTPAETINLCLLADIFSRYRTTLQQFRSAVEGGSQQVPQLIAMFEILTADVPVKQGVEAFGNYLNDVDEPDKINSKSLLFGNLFRYLNSSEGSRDGRTERFSDFNRKLINLVIRHRVRVDPFLWRHCHFLGDRDPAEKGLVNRLKPVFSGMQKAIRVGEAGVTPELRELMGRKLFDLIQFAHQDSDKERGEQEILRGRSAAHLLSLFQQKNGSALEFSQYLGEKGKPPAKIEEFLEKFRRLPLPVEELKRATARLRPVLFDNEVLAAEIQRSTLDVMKLAAEVREKSLRDIYLLNAVSELIAFPFHLGEKNISSFDRICGLQVAQSRLGLEFHADADKEASIGLFVEDDEPPLGKVTGDPGLLRLAYTELMGLRVERLVKRSIDHKINYLQQTFGQNFFEVLYDQVVTDHDLPLSRNQFATFIRQRKILGNLDAKGWKPGEDTSREDPLLLFLEKRSDLKNLPDPIGPIKDFELKFAQASNAFRAWLNEVKTGAEADPRPENPKVVLQALFKQGIYNFNRQEARKEFRKSVFYKYLQEQLAKISSEHYSTFTKGIYEGGVRIFIPWKFSYLHLIGSRFAFIMGELVVKYQLLASPTDKPEELDEISQVLYEKLEEILSASERTKKIDALLEMGEAINRTTELWQTYSRLLTLALLDRVARETLIKQLEPGRIQVQNLWFLPDSRKLCLGKAIIASQTVPFAKILQMPDVMGNIVKNPKSASTTIDEFAIQVHGVGQLRDELQTVSGIAEDLLEILQGLTHDRRDAPAIAKYEQALQQLVTILSKRLRDIGERDIQVLHAISRQIRDLLYTFYNSPSPGKQKVTTRLQAELQSRRSDGHALRLNFTDVFILDKTEIKVMQKVRQDGEMVSKQRKIEVEVNATHQTLPLRIREVMRFQEILSRKKHIVFSPEGHKKKQMEYAMDIIEILQVLRGNGVTFYVDHSGLDEQQVQYLARRVKPHNFFSMNDLKPEKPAGMKTEVAMDPLTGRPLPPQASAPPPAP